MIIICIVRVRTALWYVQIIIHYTVCTILWYNNNMVFVLSVRSSRPRTFRILLFFGVNGRGISYTAATANDRRLIYIIIKTCASLRT